MAKAKALLKKKKKKLLDSYTIHGTHKIVKRKKQWQIVNECKHIRLNGLHVIKPEKIKPAGDCVLMRASEVDKPPYVAKLEEIEEDSKKNVRVRVRWYYRPEDSIGGRRQFHGTKEVFLSDHFDTQSVDTIEDKCTVHTFRNYTKLESVGNDDYFCRFEYKASTGGFTPDRVAVYCICEMPYNPDDLMVQCEGCKDWFHPSCMKMSIEQIKKLEHFHCPECDKKEDKTVLNKKVTRSTNKTGKAKPEPKRPKK